MIKIHAPIWQKKKCVHFFCIKACEALQMGSVHHRCNVQAPAEESSSFRSIQKYRLTVMGLEEVISWLEVRWHHHTCALLSLSATMAHGTCSLLFKDSYEWMTWLCRWSGTMHSQTEFKKNKMLRKEDPCNSGKRVGQFEGDEQRWAFQCVFPSFFLIINMNNVFFVHFWCILPRSSAEKNAACSTYFFFLHWKGGLVHWHPYNLLSICFSCRKKKKKTHGRKSAAGIGRQPLRKLYGILTLYESIKACCRETPPHSQWPITGLL